MYDLQYIIHHIININLHQHNHQFHPPSNLHHHPIYAVIISYNHPIIIPSMLSSYHTIIPSSSSSHLSPHSIYPIIQSFTLSHHRTIIIIYIHPINSIIPVSFSTTSSFSIHSGKSVLFRILGTNSSAPPI